MLAIPESGGRVARNATDLHSLRRRWVILFVNMPDGAVDVNCARLTAR